MKEQMLSLDVQNRFKKATLAFGLEGLVGIFNVD